MLGFCRVSPPPQTIKPLFSSPPFKSLRFFQFPLKISQTNSRIISTRAASPNNNNNGDDEDKSKSSSTNNGGGDGGLKGNGRPRLNLRWVDLLIDPDPDNIVAVGLTGLLTWASVNVLWQLLVISLAILLAALKYSLIAALLIFILIALL